MGKNMIVLDNINRKICFSFKVWRLTGELLYEYKTNENQELWQVLWQPGTYARGKKSPIVAEDGSAPGKRNRKKNRNHFLPNFFLSSNSKSSCCL